MLANTNSDPFSTENLVNLPDTIAGSSRAWHGFVFKPEPSNEFLTLAEPDRPTLTQFRSKTLKLDIPDLPEIDLGSTTESSVSSVFNEPVGGQGLDSINDEVDLWNIPDVLAHKQVNKLLSWDHFLEKEVEPKACPSISEAGPVVFDLLLRKSFPKTHNEQLKYIKPNIMINALFDLGLGRSSIIFAWSEQNQRFEAVVDSYTVSGISQDALRYIANQFLDAGTQFRKLARFARSQHGSSPVMVALRTAVKSIVTVVEETIESSRLNVRTLIEVQEIYHRPLRVLRFLDQVTTEVRNISDECQLTSAVLVTAQRMSLDEPQFENVTLAIVSQVLHPILRLAEVEIGFSKRNGNAQKQENLMAQLLNISALKVYQETKETLLILEEFSSSFSCLQKRSNDHTILKVDFDSEAIASIQRQANDYEQQSQELLVSNDKLRDTSQPARSVKHKTSDELPKGQTPFSFDANLFTGLPSQQDGANLPVEGHDASLNRMITTALVSEVDVSINRTLTCHQAIDLSLRPFLNAQHRLLSFSALQILFQDHHVVWHMSLLGRFQFLSDGIFASRLSMSLFDSEQASGEGKRRMHTKTGLRLQSRETWPPASSELRLALMGVLSEAMLDIKDAGIRDSISFAIRDLSDEDLEKCRDIDSVYALDFLRLDYKPPTTLVAAIVTPSNLDQYDKVFNQLLRLLRLKVLTQTMIRLSTSDTKTLTASSSAHKFWITAHRFTSALADYSQTTVIRTSWFRFEDTLRHIHHCLAQNRYDETLKLAGGLDRLREMHGGALDAITRGLFLRRRQSEPKGIIDRLFEVILRSAALASKANDAAEGLDAAMARLRKDFDVHIRALVQWLRVEAGRVGGEGREMFEQLLLRLDWNGYWSR